MTLIIDLPDEAEAALKARAAAAGVPVERYATQLLERDLEEGPPNGDGRPIWDVLVDNMKDVAPEELEKLPTDGASQVDHYLYGHPKR